MTDRDIKPSTCPLCRRPQWVAVPGAMGVSPDVCAADVVCHLGVMGRNAMDCRARALLIAALVAPVVEAAVAYMAPDGSYNDTDLCDSVTAYRDSLRRLGST